MPRFQSPETTRHFLLNQPWPHPELMFDHHGYGPLFYTLLAIRSQPALGPGTPNPEALPLLQGLTLEQAFSGHPRINRDMGNACLAGIWLYHHGLHESHTLSQSIAGSTGSFWHGIMHRREPDAWNSKYWFDRVGEHPVFPELNLAARRCAEQVEHPDAAAFLLHQPRWNPHRFVDLCEAARQGQAMAEPLCLAVQTCEWQLLFDWCYRKAVQ